SSDWPIELIDNADCFDPDRIRLLSEMSAFGAAFFFALIVLIVSHTFTNLRKLSTISKRMREYHRAMTRTLVLQLAVPVMFTIFPISMCILVYFLNLDGTLIISICFVIIAMHS
ncbi:hypothetical protein PENTCL1PPCAC_15716, partial [Pristionchus entomophagus]